MEKEILIALLSRMVSEEISKITIPPGQRGPRGHSGAQGEAGKDFVFSEHEEKIRTWAKEFAMRFEDFTAEQIAAIRGPRGQDGRDGRDGQDGSSIVFADHADTIRAWVQEFALKFDDFSAEQIEKVRGPRGRDGRAGQDGKDFVFDDHRTRIESHVRELVDGIKDSLKLRFEDLNANDIEQLRGPRGRDGRDGRDFIFDDHLDFFQSLRLKFSDLTDAERDSLKLRFAHLTEEEKSTLKLRFEDLTDEDRSLIRGPRGSKGQRGSHGAKGETGPMGPRGLPGPMGIRGFTGARGMDGRDGLNGLDAVHVVEILVESSVDEFWFVFVFSDGSRIETDKIEKPRIEIHGGGGVAGRRGVRQYDTRIDEQSLELSYVGKAQPGSETSDDVWRIQRITVVDSETIIEFAEGNSHFDNIWDDRESLEYGPPEE